MELDLEDADGSEAHVKDVLFAGEVFLRREALQVREEAAAGGKFDDIRSVVTMALPAPLALIMTTS